MCLKKKIISIICMLTLTITMGVMTVSADDNGVGDIIGINNDNSIFSELVCIENGKTYLPIRLVFPNLNDKENKIGMMLAWDESAEGYSTVRLTYGSTTGDGFVIDDKGYTAPPYEGVRRCIDIILTGDPYIGAQADLTIVEYTLDEAGNRNTLNYDLDQKLDDLVYLKSVDGGDRLFLSIDDINRLADLIGLDSEYSVKLYK